MTAATASVWVKPSTTAMVSQLFADPSDRAAVITITPITRVRRSRHAAKADRKLAPRRAGTSWSAGTATAGACGRTAPGTAIARHTSVTTLAARKCATTGTPAQDTAAPISEPVTLPIENPAWNCGTTVRPIRRSMTTVSRFIATLARAYDELETRTPNASSGTLPTAGARPTRPLPTENRTAPVSSARLLPQRFVSPPATTTIASEPTDPTTSTAPSSDADRWSAVRMEGSRASQVATAIPVRKYRLISRRRAWATSGAGKGRPAGRADMRADSIR